MGRTISLYGDTGSGKTTLAGEHAKAIYKASKGEKRARLHTTDAGGYDSILPLIKKGVIEVDPWDPTLDIWAWINQAVSVKKDPAIGLEIYDSGTSMGELLLDACANSTFKIGTQATQRFNVGGLQQVSVTNQAHYGVVQNFLLTKIWKSTWLAAGEDAPDIIWTFAVSRGEGADSSPILGPKLPGNALTAMLPKWFKYTFRVVSVPRAGEPAMHKLYIQEQSENGMSTSFGNPRYPLEASSILPAVIEPASLIEAFRLIELGQDEAESALDAELTWSS